MRAGEPGNATQALVNWAAGTGRDVDQARQLGRILEQSQSSGEMAQFPEELLTNLDHRHRTTWDRSMLQAVMRTPPSQKSASPSTNARAPAAY